MATGISDVTFDNEEEFVTPKFEKYMGRKGKTDMVGFVYKVSTVPDEVDDPGKDATEAQKREWSKYQEFLQRVEDGRYELTEDKKHFRHLLVRAAKVHWSKETGPVICNSNPRTGKKGACCKLMEPPRISYGLMLCQYNTDDAGKLTSPFGYTLRPWLISESKMNSLKQKDAQFPLISHDMLVATDPKKDEKYQNMEFTSTKQALWRKKPQLEKQILEEAEAYLDELDRSIGRNLSDDELKNKFGIFDNAVRGTEATEEDLNEILSGIE